MSCCKPGYREVVNEQEQKINEKGKDSLPLFVKIIAFLIVSSVVTFAVINMI
jgi:hypothetical protein